MGLVSLYGAGAVGAVLAEPCCNGGARAPDTIGKAYQCRTMPINGRCGLFGRHRVARRRRQAGVCETLPRWWEIPDPCGPFREKEAGGLDAVPDRS